MGVESLSNERSKNRSCDMRKIKGVSQCTDTNQATNIECRAQKTLLAITSHNCRFCEIEYILIHLKNGKPRLGSMP
jgi:hypothetical protein